MGISKLETTMQKNQYGKVKTEENLLPAEDSKIAKRQK